MFEFVSDAIGAQGTVCGGGRYNHLVEEVGGKPTPAVGFGLGLERLIMVLENTDALHAEQERTDVYLAPLGERASERAVTLVSELRAAGVSAESDLMGRSFKAQMKYADKCGARFLAVMGDDELERGAVSLKNMLTGESSEVRFADIPAADAPRWSSTGRAPATVATCARSPRTA